MSLKIRSACAADADALGRLALQFASYLRSLGDTTEFKLTAETIVRNGFGDRPSFFGLVAELDGQTIGYLLYHFGYDSDRAARNLHIVDLYVDAKARRKGAGRALMTAVASIARRENALEIVWSVYHANALGKAFYESLGAVRITDVFFMKLRADDL